MLLAASTSVRSTHSNGFDAPQEFPCGNNRSSRLSGAQRAHDSALDWLARINHARMAKTGSVLAAFKDGNNPPSTPTTTPNVRDRTRMVASASNGNVI